MFHYFTRLMPKVLLNVQCIMEGQAGASIAVVVSGTESVCELCFRGSSDLLFSLIVYSALILSYSALCFR